MTKKLFIIETVSMHRMAYCIEANSSEEAQEFLLNKIDSGHMIDEFGQHHIGENLFYTQETTKEDYLALFDNLSDYLINIPEERKLSYIVKAEDENKDREVSQEV